MDSQEIAGFVILCDRSNRAVYAGQTGSDRAVGPAASGGQTGESTAVATGATGDFGDQTGDSTPVRPAASIWSDWQINLGQTDLRRIRG
mgnify:CR=1 FL=1